MIEGMRNLLTRTLGPSIQLTLELTDADAPVLADAVQLELAVLNLAINARDAMPEGGDLTIIVEPHLIAADKDLPDGEYLEIRVADSGTGMTPDVAAKAFDPFFTTKELGKGTGLGLSMVYGVAKQSGGGVRISSRPGATSVSMFLRRTGARSTPEEAQVERTAALDGRAEASILVIDDDHDVRSAVAEMLRALGYEVAEAADGPSGISMLRGSASDLVLVDFAMPGMSGAQVAEAARAIRPEQRLLFITGYAESAALEKSAPDAAVLRKPFRIGALADAVEQALKA
jgi:CheY-like chemotaxis protein